MEAIVSILIMCCGLLAWFYVNIHGSVKQIQNNEKEFVEGFNGLAARLTLLEEDKEKDVRAEKPKQVNDPYLKMAGEMISVIKDLGKEYKSGEGYKGNVENEHHLQVLELEQRIKDLSKANDGLMDVINEKNKRIDLLEKNINESMKLLNIYIKDFNENDKQRMSFVIARLKMED